MALGIVTAVATILLVTTGGDESTSSKPLVGAGGARSGNDRLGAPAPDPADAAPDAGLDVATQDPPVLGYGSAGDDVVVLQQLLASLGFDPGPADGQFGPATAATVSAFQRSRGITPDGVVGPETWSALAQRP